MECRKLQVPKNSGALHHRDNLRASACQVETAVGRPWLLRFVEYLIISYIVC